jgi:hypothetical protein
MPTTEAIAATSGGVTEPFILDWTEHRWSSPKTHAMADFPFIAEVRGKRYELYGDGTFDEQERSAEDEAAARA